MLQVSIDLTERHVVLAFVWARMRVIDEQSGSSRPKLTNLTFEDWLEVGWSHCHAYVCTVYISSYLSAHGLAGGTVGGTLTCHAYAHLPCICTHRLL